MKWVLVQLQASSTSLQPSSSSMLSSKSILSSSNVCRDLGFLVLQVQEQQSFQQLLQASRRLRRVPAFHQCYKILIGASGCQWGEGGIVKHYVWCCAGVIKAIANYVPMHLAPTITPRKDLGITHEPGRC